MNSYIDRKRRRLARIGFIGALVISGAMLASAQEPSLLVETLDGGGAYRAGQMVDIVWMAQDLSGAVGLSLWDGGRCRWVPIVARIPAGTGHFSWRIPDDLTGSFRFRVQSLDHPEIYRMGGAFFTIDPPEQSVAAVRPPESMAASAVTVAPNPASTAVTVKLDHAGATACLRDLRGIAVKELGRISGTSASFATDDLADGVYLLDLGFADGTRAVRKVVIRH